VIVGRKFIFNRQENLATLANFLFLSTIRKMTKKIALILGEKILSGFKTYMGFFNTYTRLAPIHFRERDWLSTKSNQLQRLRL
jgi:hypothetical protein